MRINAETITNSITLFFNKEVFTCILLVLLMVAAIIASIFGFRIYIKNSVLKAILIVSVTCVCSMGLIVMKAIEFLPIYTDYKNMSYTIENNAEICIAEGMNNIWDQKNEVQLKTEDGRELKLKITNDYKFETGIILKGTVVYTNRSKHIVWYDFSPLSGSK